jgi:hypothetical protein
MRFCLGQRRFFNRGFIQQFLNPFLSKRRTRLLRAAPISNSAKTLPVAGTSVSTTPEPESVSPFYCEEAMKLRVGAWLSVYASSTAKRLFFALDFAQQRLGRFDPGISLLPTGGWWNFVENDLLSLDFKKAITFSASIPPRHFITSMC